MSRGRNATQQQDAAIQRMTAVQAQEDQRKADLLLHERERNAIRSELDQTPKGLPKSVPSNLVAIMSQDPWFVGQLAVNEMDKDLYWRGQPMEAHHMSEICRMIGNAYGLDYKISAIEQECRALGEKHLINPARDYFKGLTWDGKSRWRELAEDVLHIEASELHIAYLSKLMAATVRRVMEPGCKFDNIFIIIGHQGQGKSRFFKALGGEFFGAPDLHTANSVDSRMVLHRNIINEIQEVDKLSNKTDARALKSLLSTQEDIYRVPYGRKPQTHKRMFIIVGSANESDGLIQDHTGDRRWWVVELGELKVDVQRFTGMRDQLWAEAVVLQEQLLRLEQANPEIGYFDLSDAEARLQKTANAQYRSYDPFVDLITSNRQRLELQIKNVWNRDRKKGLTMLQMMEAMDIPDHVRISNPGSIMRLMGPALRSLGWSKVQSNTTQDRSWRWFPGDFEDVIASRAPAATWIPRLGEPLPVVPLERVIS